MYTHMNIQVKSTFFDFINEKSLLAKARVLHMNLFLLLKIPLKNNLMNRKGCKHIRKKNIWPLAITEKKRK